MTADKASVVEVVLSVQHQVRSKLYFAILDKVPLVNLACDKNCSREQVAQESQHTLGTI